VITELEFKSLASEGYNRIPLVTEAFADLETPLSLYLKLAHANGDGKYSFLLESVVGGERFGRYSFIGLPAAPICASGWRGGQDRGGDRRRGGGNARRQSAGLHRRLPEALQGGAAPGLPRFCGGLAGYFGYDAVRYIEKKLEASCPPDTLGTPDILLLQCEEVAVIDNLSGKLYLIVYADPASPRPIQAPSAPARAQGPAALLGQRAAGQGRRQLPGRAQLCQGRLPGRRGRGQGADRGRRLHAGAGRPAHPQALHRIAAVAVPRAALAQPSPYMYYYHFGDFHVVGASPEILVRQEKPRRAEGHDPPAGRHAPARRHAREGQGGRAELVNDPKERAEHVMLIDLARNDIGRIAKTGSVKVTEAFVVERYSHVMHIVSNVEGILQDGMTSMDVLKATFPAGTLTGAPKVHAMELIDQLEPTKRGIYGGACGYLSFAGDMDVAIAIRTGVIKDGMLYVQAAAGVVADSVPEMEWKETEHKARARCARQNW
jgi:anthranilate synthase component 1